MRDGLKECPFCGGEAKVRPCIDSAIIQCEDCEATALGHDEDNAIAQWNWRAPAPMSSVVSWVRYDGTPETLPEDGAPVLLAKTLKCGDQFVYRHDDGWAILERQTGYYPEYPRKIGDLWSYLPAPPEADA